MYFLILITRVDSNSSKLKANRIVKGSSCLICDPVRYYRHRLLRKLIHCLRLGKKE